MKKIFLTTLTVLFTLITNAQEIVKYQVNSSKAGFDITYSNGGGNTEQRKITSSSWSISFVGVLGEHLYISAQTSNKNTEISVQIIHHGKVIETAKSKGDYVIASASASLSSKKSLVYREPYKENFTGVVPVYLYAPILKCPDMINCEKIALSQEEKVTILEKVNEKYYKIKSGEVIGYLWAGWFKRE